MKGTNRVAAAALAIALIAGIALRAAALGVIPLGFNQDEACNGYDAYSLLSTGHDHHGNLLPLAIQGFNDYRMPLFDYSLIPLIGTFGLKPWVVRFGAALWGIADLFGVAFLAWELIDLRGAAIAAALVALSPWHLFISRFGVETSSASALVTWAVAIALLAIRREKGNLLLASAALFGISLYSYSITKLFTPVMMLWLVILYRRELKPLLRFAAWAALIFAAIALPQAWLFFTQGADMEARFYQRSILAQHGTIGTFLVNWLDHFALGFMADPGDWLSNRSHQLRLLLPAQLLLAAAGLVALYAPDWRKKATLLVGWIAAAAMPGAMLQPAPNPHPLHDYLLAVPWALLAALGAVFLIDFPLLHGDRDSVRMRRTLQVTAGAAIFLALVEGAGTASFYFGGFSTESASLFQYGAEKVVLEAERIAPPGDPIVMPITMTQPYIYVLFFNKYPPRNFFSEPVKQAPGLFGLVSSFGRYRFGNPWDEFKSLPHGVFVFPVTLEHPWQMAAPTDTGVYKFPPPPAPPVMTLHFGRESYAIVTK